MAIAAPLMRLEDITLTFGGKPLSPAEVESPYIIRVAIALFMVAASIEGRSEMTKDELIEALEKESRRRTSGS